jgi:hypothetical protein
MGTEVEIRDLTRLSGALGRRPNSTFAWGIAGIAPGGRTTHHFQHSNTTGRGFTVISLGSLWRPDHTAVCLQQLGCVLPEWTSGTIGPQQLPD